MTGQDLFEELALKGHASVAARTFLNTYPSMEKEGVNPDGLSDDQVRSAFEALQQGRFAKEALPDLLKQMAQGKDVEGAVQSLGLSKVDTDEAAAIVDGIIAERASFVREKGMGAVGPLMAPVMVQLKGKLEGKAASDLLRSRIEAFLARSR